MINESLCPICEKEVNTNDKINYYCQNCRIYFKKEHLNKNLFPNEYKTSTFF